MTRPRRLRIAVTQTPSSSDVPANLECMLSIFQAAASSGAELVVFPENALFAGSQGAMHERAFTLESPEIIALQAAAARLETPLILGGVKLRSGGEVFNRALVFDAEGHLPGWYDKVHAFAAHVAGESYDAGAFEQPGDRPVIIEVNGVRLGLTICFDLRFPELYRALALAGADVLLVPSAFTRATGRVHWETLLRARAIENGAYVLASATIGDPDLADADSRATYGHALAVDPWGAVLSDLGETPSGWETVVVDPEAVTIARQRMPCLERRREAVYARPVQSITLA